MAKNIQFPFFIIYHKKIKFLKLSEGIETGLCTDVPMFFANSAQNVQLTLNVSRYERQHCLTSGRTVQGSSRVQWKWMAPTWFSLGLKETSTAKYKNGHIACFI